MKSNRKLVVCGVTYSPGLMRLTLLPGITWITVIVGLIFCRASFVAGVQQMTIAGLVGQEVELPCTVDAAKCGELHSIKWYRGLSRIFVFSESAKIAKSEGNFTDRAELLYDHNATRSSLRIKPLHVTDEALYKCEITYIEVREECSVVQFINLVTQIKPEYLKISRSDESEVQNSSLIGPFIEGDKFSLLCESGGGKPVPAVEWWNGSTQIYGDKRMEADSNGIGTGRNKIKITIGRGDLGAKYECRSKNNALEEPMVSWVELDVNVRPLKMVLTGVEHHVVQGTKVLLQCIVYGARPAANITWYNGTEQMREDFVSTSSAVKRPKTKIILTADGTYETQSSLVFTASRYENGGLITCEAVNSVMIDKAESSMKSTLALEVFYPPIVSVSPMNISVNETTDILLQCLYEANPKTLNSVKWLRDGVQVELDPERMEGGTSEQPNLLIKNSSRHDQGVYTCICENEVGFAESSNSIYVNILYKPSVRVVFDPLPPIKEVDLTDVKVYCEVIDGNPDYLQIIRWFLNDTVLAELPNCTANSTLCDVNPTGLILQNITREFHGNITCDGMSEAGWGPLSDENELIVHYPPGPATLTYNPQKVVKTKSVTLYCRVEDYGLPPADTFRWIRGNTVIQDVTSYNWTIDPVTLETEANFTCFAYNLGGEGESSSVSIEVFAPPAFIERLPPYYGALMSAQEISISCRVECSPLCSVSWLKNGKPIEKTAGSSTLYSVKNTVVPADPSTNDFNSVQSTLIWNMNSWPGGQLDRLYDNANYTCQSTSNSVGGGVRSTTFFGVEYPPENITLSKSVISVVEGQEMHEKVTCQAKAYPEPSYLWKKEGEKETISKGNILMLRYQVPRKDGGNYVCEAYNRHGSVSGKTYVNVLFKPECAITQTEQNGKPVLICTAHANPTEVDFTWKIKNENETVEDPIENKGLQSFLTFESRVENFRTYLCFANNSVGMSIPCERDVTGKAAWWPMFDNDNLLIIVAIIVGAIFMFCIVCIIIILVCRKKRADDKCEKQAATGNKLGLDPRGSHIDGLDDKAFYENLPFHGMQNPPTKKSLEARHYKLTSSQQHLLPLNNKKHSHQPNYNLFQDQGKIRHSGRRNKYDTSSMRNSKKREFPPSYNVNGSLIQNQLFFNSLRDFNKQIINNSFNDSDCKSRVKSDVKNHKDFREKSRERLKDSTPLQVMRFKELLTAGGENYNRQSNSDSSGERRANTDSSSGDTEMPISDSRHFKNISSGEESLLRDCSKSSYMTISGDHEICRPIPINGATAAIEAQRRGQTNSLERSGRSLDRRENQRTYVASSTLPLQSYYTPMGSEPLLLPHYPSLGSEPKANNEHKLKGSFAPEDSEAMPLGNGSQVSFLGSDSFAKNSVDYSELAYEASVCDDRVRNAQVRSSRNNGLDIKRNSDYPNLKFHDVGQEIDV